MSRNPTLRPEPRQPLDYAIPPKHSPLPMWFALVLLFIGLFLYAVPDLAAWLNTWSACR